LLTESGHDGLKLQNISRVGKYVLLLDASFLLVVGGVQQLFELLGHFVGIGPHAKTFFRSPYTIGFFEAHGMAVLSSILLCRAAFGGKRQFWYLYAAGIHFLLGGANLLFWPSFKHFHMVRAGIRATVAHGFFVLAHIFCFVFTYVSAQKRG